MPGRQPPVVQRLQGRGQLGDEDAGHRQLVLGGDRGAAQDRRDAFPGPAGVGVLDPVEVVEAGEQPLLLRLESRLLQLQRLELVQGGVERQRADRARRGRLVHEPNMTERTDTVRPVDHELWTSSPSSTADVHSALTRADALNPSCRAPYDRRDAGTDCRCPARGGTPLRVGIHHRHPAAARPGTRRRAGGRALVRRAPRRPGRRARSQRHAGRADRRRSRAHCSGPRSSSDSAPRLPFLLKVLAAERPLSIQVHPTLRAGPQPASPPRRRRASRATRPSATTATPTTSRSCSARSTPFEALCGFRPVDETLRRCSTQLDVPELALPGRAAARTGPAARGRSPRCSTSTTRAPLVAEVELAAAAGLGRRDALRAGRRADGRATSRATSGRALRCCSTTSGSRRARRSTSAAGNVHAYLRGTGVEIMANSDNVLRCGLTPKHVDVDELLAIADFTELAEPRWPAGRRRLRRCRCPTSGSSPSDGAATQPVSLGDGRAVDRALRRRRASRSAAVALRAAATRRSSPAARAEPVG